MPENPATPALSATLLLLRHDADAPAGRKLTVFMVKRHHKIDFASGALVFPGGRLDEADQSPALLARCMGRETFGDTETAVRACAIRETFEEAGILLAYDQQDDMLLDGGECETLAQKYRHAIHNNEIALSELLERENLRLACDRLVTFAHWVTPAAMPKRFDTKFFLASAPADQHGRHDDVESVESVWINPDQAIREAKTGKRTIVFATRTNLAMLAESNSVAEALEAAHSRDIVTVEPTIEKADGGQIFRIPKSAGYQVTEEFIPDPPS